MKNKYLDYHKCLKRKVFIGHLIRNLIGITTMAILLMTISANATPELEWSKTFGETYRDEAYSVQQTFDGGYIFSGIKESRIAWLLKTDSNGNELWNKTFQGVRGARSVLQTPDGGYILLGGGATESWLIKTDTQGNLLWKKTFERGDVFFGGDVQQTSDEGYIIANTKRDFIGNAWLIKTDSNGDIMWNTVLGGKHSDQVFSVQETSDEGYIFSGYTQSYSDANVQQGEADSWIIKTDANGNELWNKTFLIEGDNRAYSVQETSDKGYIFAIRTSGVSDGLLIKTDTNGNEQWYKPFSCPLSFVQQTLDGGYIVVCNSHDGRLIKTDINGNEQWSMGFGKLNSVQQTSDGGYILAGKNDRNFPGDAWLIKIKGDIIEIPTEAKPTEVKPTEKPIGKTSGFELVLAMMSLMATYTFKRKKR